jgi:hypothetical protein
MIKGDCASRERNKPIGGVIMKKFLVVFVLLLIFTVAEAGAVVRVGCVDPWGKQVVNNYNYNTTNNKPTAIAGATATNILSGQFGGAGGMGGAGGIGGSASATNGPITQNTTVNGGGAGKVEGYVITQFPEPYVAIPAAPLTYQGLYDSSIFEDDQIWFNRDKWTKNMIENLPNGGKVVAAIYEKTKPANFIQPREGADFDKAKFTSGYYYLGNIYCKSSSPDDNPGTVWGGCARKLLEKGCSYAYKIAGAITYGARSKATNQSGGASLAGIFGAIFGFNAGAGASNTDHDASGYEIINLTWACVGTQPQQ